MSLPLRVTSFIGTFEVGGTERQAVNLALGLQDRGCDVQFGCFRNSGRLRAELDARDIPVTEYAMRSFYSARFLTQIRALAHDLRTRGTDVLQTYNLHGNVFAVPAARLAGIPVVAAGVRDVGIYLTPWTQRVQRAACRLADVIIVNAQSIKDWLIQDGYNASRIVVVRNGVNLARFLDPNIAEPGAIRREFGIPRDVPLISLIARMCPSKGFDDLIEAMAVVHARHPDARALLVGEQLVSVSDKYVPSLEYRSKLEARARALGLGDRVIFTGYRGDLPAIHADVTVAAHPSLTEGLSNSILESMASGLPIVTTPVGGTPELITHDRTGLLVPPGSPRDLGAAICALIEDRERAARLGQTARAYARDAFSIPSMVQATEDAYREVLARKRVRVRPDAARDTDGSPASERAGSRL
jgi:glycosyltransferase involved in cell wall biosynthesis